MTTKFIRFTQRANILKPCDGLHWEPDGVTLHVRFCEGPATTGAWLRSCGTVGKPDGNRENKHQPETLGEAGLLTAGRSPIPHSLEIIQDCYAIYRRIEEELNLTHVGTEGNELAIAWLCSARSVKKKNCDRIRER
jgi:hypothetical protein